MRTCDLLIINEIAFLVPTGSTRMTRGKPDSHRSGWACQRKLAQKNMKSQFDSKKKNYKKVETPAVLDACNALSIPFKGSNENLHQGDETLAPTLYYDAVYEPLVTETVPVLSRRVVVEGLVQRGKQELAQHLEELKQLNEDLKDLQKLKSGWKRRARKGAAEAPGEPNAIDIDPDQGANGAGPEAGEPAA